MKTVGVFVNFKKEIVMMCLKDCGKDPFEIPYEAQERRDDQVWRKGGNLKH